MCKECLKQTDHEAAIWPKSMSRSQGHRLWIWAYPGVDQNPRPISGPPNQPPHLPQAKRGGKQMMNAQRRRMRYRGRNGSSGDNGRRSSLCHPSPKAKTAHQDGPRDRV